MPLGVAHAYSCVVVYVRIVDSLLFVSANIQAIDRTFMLLHEAWKRNDTLISFTLLVNKYSISSAGVCLMQRINHRKN